MCADDVPDSDPLSVLFMLRRVPLVVAATVTALSTSCASFSTARVASSALPSAMGSVHEDAFFSQALGVRKRLVVYLPAAYERDAARRFPVVYYLHGLGGTETDWLSKGSLDATADSLTAAGGKPLIVVMLDGDDGWYTTWVDQVSFRACADTLRAESPDRYCVEHQRYDDYVATDVVQYIDGHYRTLADRAHRGVAGLSMGGYGAMMLSLRHSETFGAAASHSGVVSPMYVGPHPFSRPARYASTVAELESAAGAFWPRYVRFWGTDLARWREADPAMAAASLVSRRAPMPALFLDCGRDDPFIDQNRALDAELTRLGIQHRYAEWPGAHTWRYWSTHVAQSLAWMSAQLSP